MRAALTQRLIADPAFAPLHWRPIGPTPTARIATKLQRAIGVIYRPQTERWSHCYEARLPDQFDVFIHLDRTGAVQPLERTAGWDEGEPPETWPSAV